MVCLVLAFVLVLTCMPVSAVDHENTYTNTGNQRQDLIGVALTQVGYREGANNDTKYGDWYGLSNQPWCAMFVSWCARQADISTDILPMSARARPDGQGFNITWYKRGSGYRPQPGDLFFVGTTYDWSHVGIVYEVHDDYIYTIEGNTNNDGSAEGTDVMIRSRKIDTCDFGVPAYEGCDQDHDYTLGYDSAHPHAKYYLCGTCGDRYYTGSNQTVNTCKSCISCGCSASYAGYYKVNVSSGSLYMRSKHSVQSERLGAVPSGAQVYIYAATGTGAGHWGYAEYQGTVGHVSMEYLTWVIPAPKTPTVSVDKLTCYRGDEVTVRWNAVENAEYYHVKVINSQGAVIYDWDVEQGTACTMRIPLAEKYTVELTALNDTGSSSPASCTFTVLDTYEITYCVGEGTGAPETQQKKYGEDLILSDTVPTREGYTFLGWTDTEGSATVTYEPGGTYTANAGTALFAVWKTDGATVQKVEIATLPNQTQFSFGQTVDTTGLSLYVTYSDGSGHRITEGFTTDAHRVTELGEQTVTVTYEGQSDAYIVYILEHTPGDVNLDGSVNRDDVMALLWHITFPTDHPITVPADYNGDGTVNRDDVMLLLWHITFPETNPLTV